MLKAKGLILKKGTIVDSTIISAPSSTKNANKKRDPVHILSRREINVSLGLKRISVLTRTAVHTVKVTGANVHDVTMTSELLTSEENEVYGDSGYIGADKRDDAIVRNNKGGKSNTKSIGNHRK